uniref:Reverse transcriptase Ty1/copia-type domain-containing protein n=1 Tax=Peronospora matthiolae TaxID=2874970 RepID=A0AAV1VGI3_9STRA
MLRRDVSDLDDAAKRKEPHAVILLPSKRASAKTKHDSAESTKDAVKSKRKFSEEEKEPDVSKNYTDLQEAESGDELLPAEEQTRTRMQTRNMGAKHVPVSRVRAINLKDPKNNREAVKDPRVKQWEEAMCTEIEALEHNDTWEVIQKPRDSKLLHSKWVYKLKIQARGSIDPLKANLVARGDEQVYGVDYTYTFSAVIEMISGKVILLCQGYGGNEYRCQVVTKKHGVRDKRQLALRLKKRLYGLKQSGRLWNLMLHDILMSLGLSQCYTDSCFYIKTETDGKTLVGIYVDDVLATGTDVNKVNDLFVDMQVIELKDLGVVTKFLGIAFNYSAKTGWALDQEITIDEMLDKFGLKDSAAVRVPICGEDGYEEITLLPSGRSGSPQRPTVQTFQSLVGSLLWIARCTRLDIVFPIHRATQRSHAPTEGDWRLAKKISKYWKGTKGLKLIMHGGKEAIKDNGVLVLDYSDA